MTTYFWLFSTGLLDDHCRPTFCDILKVGWLLMSLLWLVYVPLSPSRLLRLDLLSVEKLLQYYYELYGIFTLFFYKSLSHSVVDGLFWRELT